MHLRFFNSLWCALFSFFALSQNSPCPNVDVSQGNFSNWVGNTGSYYAPGSNVGIVNGRHTIITQAAFDPNTCNQLPIIPPGHTQSIRLGNMQTGAQAEQLSYTIQVTPQSTLFVYKYAVVLENPGHPSVQQPKFETRILNAAGMPIGGACGTYTVYGGQPGQNFQTCAGKTWLPWTTVGMDLTPYLGQTVQIEFTTWDCAQGAHFGYAYIVAECQPLSIDVNYCGGNQPLILTAPSGFQSYVWQPGNLTGQQVTVNQPNGIQSYTCTMTTYSNQGTCSVNLSVQAAPTTLQASMNYSLGCQNQPIALQANNTLTTNAPNVVLTNQWIVPNGNILQSVGNNAQALFNGAGAQNVMLIVQSSNGCVDTATQSIQVLPPPHLSPQINHPCIEQQTQFSLQGTTALSQAIWNFGDGTAPVNSLNPVHTYTQAGTYVISLIEMGTNGCTDTLIDSLTIHPLPQITAGLDTFLCPGNGVLLLAGGGISYAWENGLTQGQTYVPIVDQFLSVVGMDSLNCFSTDSFFVQIHHVDSIHTFQDSSICLGDSLALISSPLNNVWWEASISEGQWVSPPQGLHSFVVHGQDGNGCLSSDSVQVTVLGLPPVYAGLDTIVCAGSHVWLSASGAQSYSWSNALMNQMAFQVQENTVLTVVGMDQNGCQQSDTLELSVDPIPALAFDVLPNAGCVPLTTTVYNQSTGNVFTDVQWLFSDGSSAFGDSATLIFEQVGCFDGTLTVTTQLGCTYSETQVQALCTYPLPLAAFSVANETLTTVTNGSLLENQSQGANAYWWEFGDGSIGETSFEPYHTFPIESGGDYLVTLIAINAYGCMDTIQQEIHVETELSYYVPNAFTPDGDPFNNIWKPVFTSGLDLMDYHAMIYNRWGEVIWESYDASVGWDGSYGVNGLAVQDDVYLYQITFGHEKNAQKERLSGHIVIVR